MLTKIKLKNIRKFRETTFNFDKNIVVLTGHNGSGKTTILESIFFVSKLKSFKTNEWRNIKNNSSENSYIKANFERRDIKKTIEVDIGESKNSQINGNKSKISELSSIIKPLVIDSKTIGLFKNDKRERLKFIDDLIGVKVRIFPSLLIDFKKTKALLLKAKEESGEGSVLVESIARQLEQIEIEIIKIRKNFTDDVLKSFIQNTELYLDKTLRLVYKKTKTESEVYEELMKSSTITVSRDSFDIYLEQDSYIKYASEGEIRMSFILLAISYIELISKEFDQDFPLLLDDIFSELDNINIELLLKILIEKNMFAFITTPTISFLNDDVVNKIQEIKL